MNIVSILLTLPAVASVFIGIGCILIGLVAGYFITREVLVKKIGNSKTTAAKIIEEAYAEAKTVKKEAVLEAKEETVKLKEEAEREIKDRRSELQKAESRIAQKEQFIEKKDLFLEKKQEDIDKLKTEVDVKHKELEKNLFETNKLKEQIKTELEKVSNMKRDEAKQVLINSMIDEAKRDSIKIIAKIEEEANDEGQKRAREIVANSIQKLATDLTAEMTVSSVAIPNEEMKGRIIGREGRNIRAIETATGVDLIVDDTPDTITVSAFDPVRREIARLALEKLILDGRIHPTRIEEIVEKVKKDVDGTIKQAGENAVNETEVYGIHPDLVKILGRLKFRTSYGQNCLKHSIETCFIAGLLATELGADVKIAKRGGLLHDIGKALDHEVEGTHITIGVDLAKKYKEPQAVIHCIEAHHFNVDFESVEAVIVQIADAISSSRPGARRESLENYVKRLAKLEEISASFKGVDKAYAIQAGREIRVIVKPEEVSDETALFLAKDIAKKIEDELQYPGQIKVNVIRESRFTEIAK